MNACVDGFCEVEDCHGCKAALRIVDDTGRLYRLFMLIDGRRKFPALFTRPKWDGK